jgi:retron-type reverse transcriptase
MTPKTHVSYRTLYQSWQRARRRKKPSVNQWLFESHWLEHLAQLQHLLNRGQWQPLPSVCFIAKRPKAREIHAPDFADRVVHHWLVPQLEAIYEPLFIYDSYSNRKNKGTHSAVTRLQQFVRQVQSGQGGGYYLQLDIHNFFNSIYRPTLYALLKKRIQGLPVMSQRTVHALLKHSPLAQGVHYRATIAERALVPTHKQLHHAAKGCGLPIGNLSSQFFANVYLNELDQFIKHQLKAKRYVRYVDDFVLVHSNAQQLTDWLQHIQQFLQHTLKLRLKDDIKLKPLTSGIDFLGYWLYPTHTLVRPRVIHHAHEKLSQWQGAYVRRTAEGWLINANPSQQQRLRSVWASYQGHFSHANSYKLQQQFYARYGWLSAVITNCHSEQREESNSRGQNRCFVPQHDKWRKTKFDPLPT